MNASVLPVAAGLLHGGGAEVETLEAAHGEIGRLLGGTAALAAAVALLASGISRRRT